MRNLLDNLDEAGMNFDQVVSTNVYLDDLHDLADFDQVYVQYFGPVLPARPPFSRLLLPCAKPTKKATILTWIRCRSSQPVTKSADSNLC